MKGAIFDGFEFREEDILLKVKTDDDGERSGTIRETNRIEWKR